MGNLQPNSKVFYNTTGAVHRLDVGGGVKIPLRYSRDLNES